MSARISSIDINCDCGESFGNWTMGADELLLPMVTTANLACGFHAGDPVVMQRTVALAQRHSIAVGAHPGLPDLAGFGRRRMAITPDEAHAMVLYQVGALKAFLDAAGLRLHHVKPHGALYAMLNVQEDLAEAVARAIALACPQPLLYWPCPVERHALPRACRALGIEVIGEVYFDLGYDDEGSLVIERQKKARDLAEIAERVRRFVRTGEVLTISGRSLAMQARSICIHGDGPNAGSIAETVLATLREEGVAIASAHASEERP